MTHSKQHSEYEPFDLETFEERAAIAEFDGLLSRFEAEALAWEEDNKMRIEAEKRKSTQPLKIINGM